jgi:hypothetical protein
MIFPAKQMAAWWLFFFFMTFQSQLGISSQLTLTPSFFRGLGINHQPDYH